MSTQRYSVTPHPVETLLTWVKSKEIAIGKSRFHRYSAKAVERIEAALQEKTADDVWRDYRRRSR